MSDEEKAMLEHFDKTFMVNASEHIKFKMPLLKYLAEMLTEELDNPSPKYENVRHKQMTVSKKLHDTFSPEQEKLFREYWTITHEMSSVEAEQYLCFGYILSKMFDNEGNLKE